MPAYGGFYCYDEIEVPVYRAPGRPRRNRSANKAQRTARKKNRR